MTFLSANENSVRSSESKWALSVSNLVKVYPVGEGELTVLKNLTFRVESGEFVGIVGESGSGKSTLLHILGALDSPSSGDVTVGSYQPFLGRDRSISRFRNLHIGFVFQHNNLLPEFNALENVMVPGLIAGRKLSSVEAKARALLERVGIGSRLQHYPGQLSGGEQQRVAIARALINDPVLLLADEPSGNLDTENAANIHRLFLEVNESLGTTVVVVTHNLEFAATMPRKIELRDGSIIADLLQHEHNSGKRHK